MRWGGASKRALRQSSNRGTGDDHLFELEGVSRLTIFVPRHDKMKGYRDLKSLLEAADCQVAYPSQAPAALREAPGPQYQAMNVEASGLMPPEAVKAAHRWAHQRDFLHSFFRPL